MSEDEKRAIRGAALLEAEDAKDELALLRAKSVQWCRAHSHVEQLLVKMGREDSNPMSDPAADRAAIEKNMFLYTDTMTIQAVLALDKELERAVTRLENAEAAKKSLGFA